MPEICINGLQLTTVNAQGETVVRRQHELVQTIEGDVLISVLTSDPVSALFVINRVNQANLISADFEVGEQDLNTFVWNLPYLYTLRHSSSSPGIRAIRVDNASLAENLLIQEVQYLQQCTQYSMGLFLDHDLYKLLESIIRDLEYNVWPIPATRAHLFPKVAHLLHQMPWGEKIASVEIVTDSLDIYNEFMEAARQEHMCLMHFKSDDNVYILFGNRMANHFKENGTVFVVATERTDPIFLEGNL